MRLRIEGAGRLSLLVFFGMATAASLLGCGQPDISVKSADDFWKGRELQFASAFRQEFQKRGYLYLMHVDFIGEDFGQFKNVETEIYLGNLSEFGNGRQPSGPLATYMLHPEDGALVARASFHEKKILASLVYRRYSIEKAIRAFGYLFSCHAQHSDLLSKTFLLGTGASHGVAALQSFDHRLKATCGKEIDFALLGDAIDTPGPFSMRSYDGFDPAGTCLHFYQTNLQVILQGAPLDHCFNIHVDRAGHSGFEGLASYPLSVASNLLDDLDFSREDLGFATGLNGRPRI